MDSIGPFTIGNCALREGKTQLVTDFVCTSLATISPKAQFTRTRKTPARRAISSNLGKAQIRNSCCDLMALGYI